MVHPGEDGLAARRLADRRSDIYPGPDSLTRAAASRSNLFHADVLLSYQPVPGTVVFAGYGSNMTDEEAFQFRGLKRTDDAFFLKVSYLFRL